MRVASIGSGECQRRSCCWRKAQTSFSVVAGAELSERPTRSFGWTCRCVAVFSSQPHSVSKTFFVLLKDMQSLRHGEQGVIAESEQVPPAEFSLREHQFFFIRWNVSGFCPKLLKCVVCFVFGYFLWLEKGIWPNSPNFFRSFQKKFVHFTDKMTKKQRDHASIRLCVIIFRVQRE